MEKNKKIIAALKKAFKKLYGKDDFFFILGAYTKDPDIFPKPAAELLEKIKADLMNELYLNITGWGDYYRAKKVYAWDKAYKDQDGATHFKYGG